MKRLRSRRCAERRVLLRLTVSEAALLQETLNAVTRQCPDTDGNRSTILICDTVVATLRDQISKQQNKQAHTPPT
jgi:hypothetical protein